MLNACTTEIDYIDDAVAEILEQLDLDNALLNNSAGILTCYSDYVNTGVVEALCKKLPFDVMGLTTLNNSTRGQLGDDILSLSVLTADDASFSLARSEPLAGKDVSTMGASLKKTYDDARSKLPGDPAFILLILPMLTELTGAQMLKQLDAACGGIPIFGAITNDETLDFRKSQTIFASGLNAGTDATTAAVMLVHGNVNPKFYVTSIPEKNIQKQKAIITDSDGYLLKRVNDLTLLEYLSTLGLTSENGGLDSISSVPFLVDYGVGTQSVALGMYKITPEGYALCGGEMPVGSTLVIASIDYDGIIETAESTVKRALGERNDINGMLMLPCLTRSLMISPHYLNELKKTVELLGDTPYLFAYSGGEICPIYSENGEIYNRFHNYTFTACTF